MIIDSHLHVWSDDEARYPYGEVSRPETGDRASVELLNEHMAEEGVEKAVIVQPIHYLYDNRYVADCLARFPGRWTGERRSSRTTRGTKQITQASGGYPIPIQ